VTRLSQVETQACTPSFTLAVSLTVNFMFQLKGTDTALCYIYLQLLVNILLDVSDLFYILQQRHLRTYVLFVVEVSPLSRYISSDVSRRS
jgi:hypothetical protein